MYSTALAILFAAFQLSCASEAHAAPEKSIDSASPATIGCAAAANCTSTSMRGPAPAASASAPPDAPARTITATRPLNPAEIAIAQNNNDRSAFFAYASNNQPDLARYKSLGGDPRRYARLNTEAIYYAVGGSGTTDLLQFVLDNGGDPNASMRGNQDATPLLLSGFDLKKIVIY